MADLPTPSDPDFAVRVRASFERQDFMMKTALSADGRTGVRVVGTRRGGPRPWETESVT